jgi:hypothetical protein
MTVEEQIRSNAEMTIAALGPASGIEGFGYNAASVKWLEGLIEHQRTRPDLDKSALSGIVSNLGSYLGECVIARFGGAWQMRDDMWCVAFDSANAVFPFNKVYKQFENGTEGGDGVYGWFTTIPAVFSTLVKPTA